MKKNWFTARNVSVIQIKVMTKHWTYFLVRIYTLTKLWCMNPKMLQYFRHLCHFYRGSAIRNLLEMLQICTPHLTKAKYVIPNRPLFGGGPVCTRPRIGLQCSILGKITIFHCSVFFISLIPFDVYHFVWYTFRTNSRVFLLLKSYYLTIYIERHKDRW